MPPTPTAAHLHQRITALPDNTLRIRAPAKLNLGLRVFPPRPDGFHNLESWFVPLSWHDTLTLSPAGNLEFTLSGRTQDIPTDPAKNLITRAAVLLAEQAKIPASVNIHLHKILPPGGGLGGGSSDAASALLALNVLWQLKYSPDELLPLAEKLGSDVPFFIRAVPTLCTGRGEIMTPLPAQHPLFTVLIIPSRGCPTKDVFHAFDAMQSDSPPAEKIDWQYLAGLTADELNRRIVNDLAPPAYKTAPWLAELQEQSQTVLRRPVHLTGSGSTLFTLCSSSRGADAIQSQLRTALDAAITPIAARILAQG